MAELGQKKQRNYAIDFWRIYCTIGVAMMHFNTSRYSPIGLLGEDANALFQNGGLLLGYFFLIGGYLMIASFKSKQRKGLTQAEPIDTQTWKYVGTRIQGMFPALILGCTAGWATTAWANGFSLQDWYTSFCLSVYDFLGLSALGAIGTPAANGGTHQWGFLFGDTNPEQVFSPNFPLWYLSGIFVCSIFLYYLLLKDEKQFKCIWAPFFSMAFLAAFGFDFPNGNWGGMRSQLLLGIPVNVFWVGGGLCIGCLLWYFINWLKQKEYGPKAKIALTVLNVSTTVYLIYMSATNYFQYHWVDANGDAYYNEHVFLPAMVIVIICNCLQKDYLTQIMNIPVLGKIGEFSLYFFVCHYPMRTVAMYIGLTNNFTSYYAFVGLYLALTAALGGVFMVISKKWLIPMLGKFFADPKPAVPAEAK